MLRAFCRWAPGFVSLLLVFLSVNPLEPHVLDRYDQAPPKPGTALTACAGFAVFSLSLRQIPACCTCGAGAACVDCTDFGYRYSAWRVVVGDLAGRNRRLAASRQYPQESRGARGRHAARRVARAWTDPAAIGYAFHHDHLRAAGSDCRRLCVSRHRQARVYRVADGHYDDHRRGTRRPVDRGRTVAHLDGADRDCDSARVFVRAAAIRHLLMALPACRQHARERADLQRDRGGAANTRGHPDQTLPHDERAAGDIAFIAG